MINMANNKCGAHVGWLVRCLIVVLFLKEVGHELCYKRVQFGIQE